MLRFGYILGTFELHLTYTEATPDPHSAPRFDMSRVYCINANCPADPKLI
jgi:hypothetical protein